ncbi:hypothetical protein B0T16DRAFT_396143 [Cercophora newfieldiana]|uniref:Secreted protein n=1 Tax=Cercophora newfieldiana TaxID=92897 RepID=A0AA40CXJ6_9PEZI|nr:hypothetical protein B0T16DRAFT_396143 [Cercophora newfieldiana]
MQCGFLVFLLRCWLGLGLLDSWGFRKCLSECQWDRSAGVARVGLERWWMDVPRVDTFGMRGPGEKGAGWAVGGEDFRTVCVGVEYVYCLFGG